MHIPTRRTTLFAAAAVVLSCPAFADHNSVWGAGWASMPNDIHNTRIDTRLADDNDTFVDFVRSGAGADSVNRYLVDNTDTARGRSNGTGGAAPQAGGRR